MARAEVVAAPAMAATRGIAAGTYSTFQALMHFVNSIRVTPRSVRKYACAPSQTPSMPCRVENDVAAAGAGTGNFGEDGVGQARPVGAAEGLENALGLFGGRVRSPPRPCRVGACDREEPVGAPQHAVVIAPRERARAGFGDVGREEGFPPLRPHFAAPQMIVL